jgi:hypothetical protein
MGNNLDFHEWIELPGDFDTDWHEQLRTNWEDSETRLIKSGSLANRPSSAPDGAYYLVEDSGDKRLTRYDENASGWVDEIVNPDGHDISPSSVSTDQLLNAQLNDGVNYLSLLSIVESAAIIPNADYGSPDEYSTSTSGSNATVDKLTTGVRIDTGSSPSTGDNAKATSFWERRDDSGFNTSFDKDIYAEFNYNLIDGEDIFYATIGDVAAGQQGFGVKIADVGGTPTLQAVAHDGSSESTADVAANPGRSDIEIQFDSGTEVKVIMDNGEADATVSSTLPSGASAEAGKFVSYCESPGNRVRIDVKNTIQVVQAP